MIERTSGTPRNRAVYRHIMLSGQTFSFSVPDRLVLREGKGYSLGPDGEKVGGRTSLAGNNTVNLMDEGEHILITHCPICGYPLAEPMPKKTLMFSFSICDCCGCEYGADDTPLYREAWLRNGAPWFNGTPPPGWDHVAQLKHAQMDWNIDIEQL